MTKKELLEALKNYPDDMQVFVHDFESQMCRHIDEVTSIKNHKNSYDCYNRYSTIEDTVVLELDY